MPDDLSKTARIPSTRSSRLRQLPDSRFVHVTDLYTAEELKTSPTYNELLRRVKHQDSLNARLDGLDGSRMTWCLGDPVASEGWGSSQIAMVTGLLPHIRQFVRVRQALVGTEARATTETALLDNPRIGVLHLDRRGAIMAVNDCARRILRRGDGLLDRDGMLRASAPADQVRLERLVQEEHGANAGADTGPAQRRRRHARGRRGSVHGHDRVTAWQDGADAQRKNTRRGFRFVWPSTRAGRRPRPPVANDRVRHRLIGYAHVSHDVASGVRDDCQGLDSCVRALRPGDVLVVWKLDRLGRTLAHLVNTVQDLSARGVGRRVLTGQGAQIDTTTAAGRLVFGIFAALAEFERELIRERTLAGLTVARPQGRQDVRAVESPGAAGPGRDGAP